MLPCQRSAASAKAKQEGIKFLLAGKPSKLVEAIIQIVLSDLRGRVQRKLKHISKNLNELLANVTNVNVPLSDCAQSFEILSRPRW